MIGRRQILTLLGGAAAAWPVVAQAQQPERMRRVGVLMSTLADHPEGQSRLLVFQQAMEQFGWSEGRNLHTDIRWGIGDANRFGRYAAELVALSPDVIMS